MSYDNQPTNQPTNQPIEKPTRRRLKYLRPGK